MTVPKNMISLVGTREGLGMREPSPFKLKITIITKITSSRFQKKGDLPYIVALGTGIGEGLRLSLRQSLESDQKQRARQGRNRGDWDKRSRSQNNVG
jgi:hypothetical protein